MKYYLFGYIMILISGIMLFFDILLLYQSNLLFIYYSIQLPSFNFVFLTIFCIILFGIGTFIKELEN